MGEPSAARAAEAALVGLAKTGDDQAFHQLVLRRQKWLLDLMHRLGGDASLAEDLTQEAFVQAWRNLRTLHSPLAFGGWLRQVAVNVWLQHARRGAVVVAPLDGLPEDAAPSASEDPADRLDLTAALARLPAAERACVVLCYAEGMSHIEAAVALDLPLGTVKSHVTRGAQRLRKLLSVPHDG